MTKSEWLVNISMSLSKILGVQISTESYRHFSLLFFTNGRKILNQLNEFEVGTFVQGFPQLVADESRRIFTYESANIPNDMEILEKYSSICWREIQRLLNLDSLEEVNTGLRTRIGALKKEFQRNDIAERLDSFCDSSKINPPVEGKLDAFSKRCIYNFLIKNSILDIMIASEFLENPRRISLDGLSENLFIEEIKWNDYYISDVYGSIVWLMDWDDFYYSVLGTKENLEKYVMLENVEEIQLTNIST